MIITVCHVTKSSKLCSMCSGTEQNYCICLHPNDQIGYKCPSFSHFFVSWWIRTLEVSGVATGPKICTHSSQEIFTLLQTQNAATNKYTETNQMVYPRRKPSSYCRLKECLLLLAWVTQTTSPIGKLLAFWTLLAHDFRPWWSMFLTETWIVHNPCRLHAVHEIQ